MKHLSFSPQSINRLWSLLPALMSGLLLQSCASAQIPDLKTRDLAKLINDYRVRNGLNPLPLSGKLTNIARAHVIDAEENSTGFNRLSLHSWGKEAYNRESSDKITRQAREKVGYTGDAYEISGVNSHQMTAEIAIDMWTGSSSHSSVILQQGVWLNHKWKAMGVCYGGRYAYAWFGTEADETPLDVSQPIDKLREYPGINALKADTSTSDDGLHFKVLYFQFEGGKKYRVEAKGTFSNQLVIRNADQQLLAKKSHFGQQERFSAIDFVPPTDGVYSVLVASQEPGVTGRYSLSITPRPQPRDPPNETVIDGKLTQNSRMQGGRFFKIESVKLNAGTEYTISLASETPPLLIVNDAQGKTVASQQLPDKPQTAKLTPAATEKYNVICTTAQPGRTGVYRLTITPSVR